MRCLYLVITMGLVFSPSLDLIFCQWEKRASEKPRPSLITNHLYCYHPPKVILVVFDDDAKKELFDPRINRINTCF